MKGIEFAFLAIGAVAGAFVRYKLAESPLILGTLPVNILVINVIGSSFWAYSLFFQSCGIWTQGTRCSRPWDFAAP